MKCLDFKIIKIFYVNLIAIAFLFSSFTSALLSTDGGAGGGLYAQDPQLFNHTWYFVNGEYDGEEFFPVSDLQGELSFTNDNFTVYHSFCEEGGGGSIVEYQNNNFILEDFFVVLVGVCGEPNLTEFMHKHYSIYGDYEDSGTASNPFSYTIETVDEYLQLNIENGEGDWAVYNNVLLSTPSFVETTFTIYPNPVKETLYINNTSNKVVLASVYDINGKLLQNHSLENNLSRIDVKAFNTGLYFVIFESETGERLSKKFIKQ